MSNLTVVSASFARPADTTQYAANDVVCNSTSAPTVLTFANAFNGNAASGQITLARHMKNSTNVTNALFRLWLFRTAPTAINDNAQFPLLWADRNNRLGFIDFSHATGGTGSDSTSSLVTYAGLTYKAAAGESSIYGILTAGGAYTPSSAEQHLIELHVEQF